jgi:acyl-CoA thioesterase-1
VQLFISSKPITINGIKNIIQCVAISEMNKKKLGLLTIGLVILIISLGATSFYMLSDGKEDKIRVACVGDSITEGTYYPLHLWMLLGENYTVGIFGVGGSTASLDSEKPYINNITFQDAKEFKPTIVIIMLGTNDANPTIARGNESLVEDYGRLVSEFQALSTKPKIYIVKPPPIFSNSTVPNAQYFADNVIPNIEQMAKQYDLPIIDVYSALMSHSDFFPDGVHPNDEGAKLIANVIFKAITS